MNEKIDAVINRIKDDFWVTPLFSHKYFKALTQDLTQRPKPEKNFSFFHSFTQ